MRIVQINATCGVGSTGKICVDISKIMSTNGIENYILYSSKSNGYAFGIRCSNDSYLKLQAIKAKICGNYGFNSCAETKKIINELERIEPDIVHIHNIHGHDCNLEKLFNYLSRKRIKLVWTFHDCWAFTGYCTHFMVEKCDKWIVGCSKCPQRKKYSWLLDRSRELYYKKNDILSKIDLTIVTPSQWLALQVRKSFLKDCSLKVVNNGIDFSVFQPRVNCEDVCLKYNISKEKNIILGIAFDWSYKKGLDVFIELKNKLDMSRYQIVLVGINDSINKQIPKEIITIHRTSNQDELAKLYSIADVFVNPTREDTFPTVNIEALACGTPVITFDIGGSPEIIDDSCGSAILCDDIDALEREIVQACTGNKYSSENCLRRASIFNKDEMFLKYIELYKDIINE